MLIFVSCEMSSSGQVLFTDIVKLYVKSPEERERSVQISVELVAGSTPVNEKAVYINVTDEEDPLFYYGITINHEEFLNLKSNQKLLIDFNKFAEQLIHLLKLCSSKAESPKYLLLLEEESSESVLNSHQLYLKLIEKNDFKQLCHLSLKVGDHSIDEIKEYMVSKMKSLKVSASKSNKKVSLLEDEIAKLKSDLAAACSMQEEIRKQWAEEKRALEISHVKELTAERERLADAKLLWQKEEEQRKVKEQKEFFDRVNKLELELTSARAQYNGTRDKLAEAKELNHTLSEKLSTMSSQLNSLRQDLPRLKKQNFVLDTDYHEKKRQLDIIRADSIRLKEELRAKTVEAGNYMREIQTLKEEKAELKRSVDNKDKECKVLMGKNEELEKDISKANSIICTIQRGFDDLQRELLNKNTLLTQREKLMAKKERDLRQYSGEYTNLVEKIKQLESIRDALNHQLHTATVQLTMQDKELAHNRNVIGWLNRQLTEAQGRLPVAPVTSSTPYRGFSRDVLTRPSTPGQPITNPCWQTLRPRWWSDTSAFARFPSATVRWSTPESVMPSAVQGGNVIPGSHTAPGAQANLGTHADQGAHAHQGEHIRQVEDVAQGEAISQSGGPQEPEKKTTSQVEHQSADTSSPTKKSSEPAGFTRRSSRSKYVKPRNTPSSYFPGAV